MKKPGTNPPKLDAFSFFTIAIALLVTFLIGSAIFAILISGAPNFIEAICTPEVLFALTLSLTTATVSTAVCFLLAAPTAYALTKTAMPLKKVANVILELTLSLPHILLGLSLLIIFSSGFGEYLRMIGIQFVFSPAGIVMAQLLVNLPFAIRLTRTAFANVDERLEYISKSLGASTMKSFLNVTLPLSRNSLISTYILTWARAMGEFGATLMLVGITRMKTETLPGSIYLNISTGHNEMAMATAILMLFISGIALLISNILSKSQSGGRLGIRERR
jgi:molybdate transport system permease protein